MSFFCLSIKRKQRCVLSRSVIFCLYRPANLLPLRPSFLLLVMRRFPPHLLVPRIADNECRYREINPEYAETCGPSGPQVLSQRRFVGVTAHQSLAVTGFTAAAMTVLTTLLTGFGCTLRIIFKVPAAVLSAFTPGFGCFSRSSAKLPEPPLCSAIIFTFGLINIGW